MSIGGSGRIVLEVDPQLKRRLYAALATDGSTLKAWFTKEASSYINRDRASYDSAFTNIRTEDNTGNDARNKSKDGSI